MRAFLPLLAMLTGLISDGPLTTNSTATARLGTYSTVASGTITNAVSGAPLRGAQIHVEGLTLSALAANDGRYRLTIPASAGSEVVIRSVTAQRCSSSNCATRNRPGAGAGSSATHADRVPSSDFTFATSVAAFGMVLRDSKYCGSVDLAAVLRWARSAVGPDLEGYRREFARMVEAAQHLADRG